ncbi:hypothetical protein QBC34DRAFT_375383 [Podospora aff. communis PSN243]|uniref:REJ domain-containing protein n=1 Tax=Podospora aff. communis PSN243 TaxID=3040156 RepID=A0AAV9H0R8_9PEZI|nr:hypothetical protein QBC34DRAFT_375383 [Podospora aff. communis PSN243]
MKTERRDSWPKASSEPPGNQQSSSSPRIKQSDSPPLPPIKTSDSPPPSSPFTPYGYKMSGSNNGSSSSDKTDWNSLLKHSSALGILKPGIVFNSSGYSGSSSASGSSSSRYTSSYTSGTSGGGSSSSNIWSSSNPSGSGSGSGSGSRR